MYAHFEENQISNQERLDFNPMIEEKKQIDKNEKDLQAEEATLKDELMAIIKPSSITKFELAVLHLSLVDTKQEVITLSVSNAVTIMT